MSKRTRSEEYKTNSEFLKTLIETTAHDVHHLKGNFIYVAARDENIVSVWNGMIKHNLLAVPVVCKKKGKFYGFLDLMDIVQYFVKVFGETELQEAKDFQKLIDAEAKFQKVVVSDLMVYPISRRNPFEPISENFSMYFACELLAKKDNLHRIPVVNDQNQLVSVFSQSFMLKHITQSESKIGSKLNKPISDCPHFFKKVVEVQEYTLTINAFNEMVVKNITGVAVVNSKNQIVGTLSLRDLKVIAGEKQMFPILFKTVKDFMKELDKKRPRKTVTVKKEDTLKVVIANLKSMNVHRIFVVDNDSVPIGVIGLKDILYEIIHD
eukprot:gene4665-8237_t